MVLSSFLGLVIDCVLVFCGSVVVGWFGFVYVFAIVWWLLGFGWVLVCGGLFVCFQKDTLTSQDPVPEEVKFVNLDHCTSFPVGHLT